ncbi:hypothetical protein CLV92_10192 [Kineococcus xinjiangensis]|uniref:DUF456 domain-containing protein n=1 Tax=Kineococcus xinjiangensis TaxID=512762 RepID=A0A2S6IVK4_9ACTN|nr:DUF456 domain-containing protein [Kineococcus xinjiangensis]PPK98397.1 hypothetical protein CLV92_10192 [Kineococcus xinjiangensis]
MGDAGLLLVALVMAVGVAGTLLPVLPGALLVLAAGLAWAWLTGGAAWWVLLGMVVVLSGGQVAKYLLPGRRMQELGIPNRTLFVGAALAVAGFFAVPVVGLPLGFVAGVYLAESARLRGGGAEAWRSTVHALKAAGLSMAIEVAAALLAVGGWAVAALVLRG